MPRTVIRRTLRMMPEHEGISLQMERELKTERMELRLAPSAKALIQQAMAVTGLAAGDLACEGARRLLAENERMVLSGRDREAFLEALQNPPEPTDALVGALRRHREHLG